MPEERSAGLQGQDGPAAGPLTGLRVLDLATVVAGPFSATLLADFGADVIKVELPGRGDTLRALGPVVGNTSYWWAAEARNKRGVTLDLRQDAGRALLLELVAVSDILVENFVPGTLEAWGLGPEILHETNPRLVIARVSGFGQTGPYRTRPGYDRIGAAFGGLWHLTGRPDGEPVRPGLSVVDYMTGALTTVGMLMALYARDAGGHAAGQVVDVALFESVVRSLEYTAAHYSGTGEVRGRVGNAGPAVPSGAYRTRDGRWVMLITGEDRQFRRLMHAIEAPALAEDPRFASNAGRLDGRAELDAAIAAWFSEHDLETALRVMQEADISMIAAHDIADLFADPHVAAREDLLPLEDPVLGPLRVQGIVPKLSGTPGSLRSAAPRLGEHNEQIYNGLLGRSAEALAALHAAGAI
jgi:crotonobetainyl-CoA:carnitine CoA-transferase CaiB-like acyl-CoA transferase